MRLHSLLLTGLLCACGTTDSAVTQQSTPELHSSINACDDGPAASAGDARCESCLEEASCAAGPDPVWLVDIGKCVCTDNDPANCVYEFCCALSFKWDPRACACVPDTGDDC